MKNTQRRLRATGIRSRFEVRTVGGSQHKELWVPAEERLEFNRNIVGRIEVIARVPRCGS
jgi:hypothetical protein